MHPYLGDFLVSQTVSLAFNTSDLGGAPVTLAGTPALYCYRDDSTTEDNSGITLTTDYDARTGLHRVQIVLTDDATFYAAAHDFFVVITSGTVDGVSVVGKCVAQFSVQNRAPYLTLTTAVADSVPADGTRPSIAQGVYMITQRLLESAVSGTTLTVKKVDGSTTLFTCTLDSATAPASITRAT